MEIAMSNSFPLGQGIILQILIGFTGDFPPP